VLVAFGGAAAQHACAIARSLGIRRILLHPLAGILSAHGISVADVRRFGERSVLEPLTAETLDRLEPTFGEIERRLRGEVLDAGVASEDLTAPLRLLDLRYADEHTPITITRPDDGDWAGAFARMHQQLYGHVHRDRTIEVATLRVEQTGHMPKPTPRTAEPIDRVPEPAGTTTVYFDAEPHNTPRYERSQLHPGDRITGPAIIYEDLTTVVIDPGWNAVMTERFDLVLSDEQPHGRTPSRSTECDPIRLELFNNHFTHIATQMGVTLQRTSLSVNVKERLDFSCAVLDAEGRLVVNGPHMPVHLGAMGATVRGLIDRVDDLRPGDAYLTNDPDLGGSHLPDLTVMTPVFDPSGKELRFFTASRAHHAEVGGLRPGSTFPWPKNLAEEGVVFRNLRLARGGGFDERALRDALRDAPYPSRSPDENVADVRAALAANTLGAHELSALIDRHTWPVVRAYMGHIRDAAADKCRAMIRTIGDGRYELSDQLDDGAPLCLAVTVDGDRMAVDFTGTGPVNDNAFNANRAIVSAALLYCLRCIIDEDVPLNSGVLEPIDLIVPRGMLDPPACDDPRQHAAVAAGNVELSQRVTDLFFGALGVLAACQGTMNNFVFGDGTFGYYETICGGAGAGPDFDGADAIHTHMTNTRLTDVEVLERRYPVRVRSFTIRRGSGGAGRHHGGAGVVREVEFLQPLQVSLMTQRRRQGPFGLAGASPGEPGRNTLRRAGSASDEALGALAQFDVQPRDVLTIHTPGGGGYG
jgi:5-oxoprolinase (ATP-hydrolysing)